MLGIIRMIISLCLIFIMLFSILPMELIEELLIKFDTKVRGYRCMHYIYRMFHLPHENVKLFIQKDVPIV
jgi:hypothetical protein